MIDNICFIKRIKKRVLISIEWTLILYLILDPLLHYPTTPPTTHIKTFDFEIDFQIVCKLDRHLVTISFKDDYRGFKFT